MPVLKGIFLYTYLRGNTMLNARPNHKEGGKKERREVRGGVGCLVCLSLVLVYSQEKRVSG